VKQKQIILLQYTLGVRYILLFNFIVGLSGASVVWPNTDVLYAGEVEFFSHAFISNHVNLSTYLGTHVVSSTYLLRYKIHA